MKNLAEAFSILKNLIDYKKSLEEGQSLVQACNTEALDEAIKLSLNSQKKANAELRQFLVSKDVNCDHIPVA